MIRQTTAVLMMLAMLVFCGCGKEEKNEVSIDQFNIDKSNDYKYIFRDLIREEKNNEKKHKQNPFRE